MQVEKLTMLTVVQTHQDLAPEREPFKIEADARYLPLDPLPFVATRAGIQTREIDLRQFQARKDL